jgi:hypothetical protein
LSKTLKRSFDTIKKIEKKLKICLWEPEEKEGKKKTTMNQIRAGIDLHNKNSIVAILKYRRREKKSFSMKILRVLLLKQFGNKAIINHNLWVSVCESEKMEIP